MKSHKKAPNLPSRANKHRDFIVQEGQHEQGLLAYLVQHALSDKSRTSVKQILSDRYISVNGEATSQWDRPLAVGDIVSLNARPLPTSLSHKQVDIIWQDEHLVLIHKRAGIPTVSSGEERDETAMQVVSKHLKKFNPRAKVFLLNRIDKDSAGFVLMAKSPSLQREITEHWSKYVLRQTFVLVAEGQIPEAEGYLAPPSTTDKLGRKPSRQVQGASTAGQARYRRLEQGTQACLLSVDLLSGRNNRLRRQLASMKRPIMGDWRNGSPRKELGFVALDATAFAFIHPITGKRLDFEQGIPGRFRQLLKS